MKHFNFRKHRSFLNFPEQRLCTQGGSVDVGNVVKIWGHFMVKYCQNMQIHYTLNWGNSVWLQYNP